MTQIRVTTCRDNAMATDPAASSGTMISVTWNGVNRSTIRPTQVSDNALASVATM